MNMRRLLQLSLSLLLSVGACAENTQPKKPEVKSLGGSRHQIGKITFDSKLGTIEFDAALEQNEVLIEYLLVSPHGKIHESVFISEIQPYNLNLAMKLLGYKESKELLPVLTDDHTPTGKLHTATAEQKKHSRFSIKVSWEIDGKTHTHSANELLYNTNNMKSLGDHPWIYSGSYVLDGKFKPDLTGDIFAIFTDSTAVANYSGKGRRDDTIWLPKFKLLPPLGTKVHFTLTKIKPAK